jgi:hypothetical protein
LSEVQEFQDGVAADAKQRQPEAGLLRLQRVREHVERDERLDARRREVTHPQSPAPLWIKCPACTLRSGVPIEQRPERLVYTCDSCGHQWTTTPDSPKTAVSR